MKRKFAEVLSIINGRNQKKVENPNGKYPIYGSGGVMGYADDYLCKEDTVVLGRKGNINKPIFVDQKFWNVDTAFGLEACREILLPKYLYYFCCRYDFERHNKTVTIPSLTKKDLLEIEMEVPELPAQNHAVEVLDAIQENISNRQHVLTLLDELVKSRFVEMFGDPVTNPYCWPIKFLTDLGSCKNGMNFHREDEGYKIHCLGVGDFRNFSVISDIEKLPIISLDAAPAQDYLLQNEDIVFVRSNGNKKLVGRCVAVYPDDVPMTFSGFCIRFRKSRTVDIQTRYLLQVLKSDGVKMQMEGRGANIQNLNQKILAQVKIPIPPLGLQTQFSTFVHRVEATKTTVRAQLAALTTLRAKMMQEFFG